MEKTVRYSLFILIGILTRTVTTHKRPHIFFIVADDLGWNDVGWINPDIYTPNLDQLAGKGVVLNSSYAQPTCTPYYPFHTGLPGKYSILIHGVVYPDQPKYVPLNFTLLPQKLKKLDMLHIWWESEWHLGFCNKLYTPTFRGLTVFSDLTAEPETTILTGNIKATIFDGNNTVYKEAKGKYSTNLFAKYAIDVIEAHDPEKQPLFMYLAFKAAHTPLQVPKKYLTRYEHILNKDRRIYSAMVTAMDEAIGKIVTALREKGYMDNLLLVFTSDNGAASYISGSSWPLRGAKTTLWEGGTRVPGFVFSKTLLKKSQYVNNELVHAVDWFPTLLAAAGGNQPQGIDGINQWRVLRSGQKSARNEFIYNIDDVKGNAAIRMGDYKLIRGGSGRYNNWYRPRLQKECDLVYHGSGMEMEDDAVKNRKSFLMRSLSEYASSFAQKTGLKSAWNSVASWYQKMHCARMKEEERMEERKLRQPNIQLYNIKEDPLEQHNIAKSNYHIVQKLKRRLERYEKTLVKAIEPRINPKARPIYHSGVWSPGWC
ncbi:hypothetical protein ACJMK2_020657 [Sinanodonta woodiana]|uniref:Sulfatase N-terminal domain-containing protein n=1 Tax=Sinanodonta woodiana TaxID=1069815 RepID=A0ABD3U0T6_SINWO